jgi:hypothetical protein
MKYAFTVMFECGFVGFFGDFLDQEDVEFAKQQVSAIRMGLSEKLKCPECKKC